MGAWAADAINTTTYTIHGLAEFRRYYIQIYGGDESQGDNNFDSTFYVVEVKTLVLRTCALLLEKKPVHTHYRGADEQTTYVGYEATHSTQV